MESSETLPTAFQVYPADNVATLLSAVSKSKIFLCGAATGQLTAHGDIELGHKIAVRNIQSGKPIVKFGVVIGQASRNIEEGEWVHLHNCISLLDERSGTLDLHTGLPGDTQYE